MDDKTLKDHIKDELKKIRGMSWPARIQYIWDYYKPLMAGIIGFILFISILVSVYHNMQINHLLNVYLVSSGGYSGEGDLISMQFAQRLGGIGKNDEILVDTSINIDSEDYSQYSYANNMKLTAIVGAGEADLLVLDDDQLQNYLDSGGLTPISDTCGEEAVERWSKWLLTGVSSNGKEAPVAVRLTGSPILEAQGLYADKECYAIFLPLGKHEDLAVEFVDFLLGL